jgi:transcriptional regulator with PAS, ATPase and Fis domain
MALKQYSLKKENQDLRARVLSPGLRHPEFFSAIVTQSATMRSVFNYIEAIASSPEPVLIVGESGAGKELVTHALHLASQRAGKMVSVNIAGIDDNTFADTLFGHVKGAFTGAEKDRKGMIETADGGTLVLDEIGDLGEPMQVKLLRLLQEREYFPLGTDQSRHCNCRIIAVTNRDLRSRMREGRFREDLYYRLHAHLIHVPPLRERLCDIQPLVQHFLAEAATTLGKTLPTIPRELTTHLCAYRFPGNIRELRAMVMDAVARHDKGMLPLSSFHEHMNRNENAAPPQTPGTTPAGDDIAFGQKLPSLQSATASLIQEAIRRSGGNQGAAARLLGISRRTVNRYAKE